MTGVVTLCNQIEAKTLNHDVELNLLTALHPVIQLAPGRANLS